MKFSKVTFMKLVATFAAVSVAIIINDDLVVRADNVLRPRQGAVGNINTNIVEVRGALLPEYRNGKGKGKGKGGGGKKGKKGKASAAPSFAPSVEPSESFAPSVSSAPSTEPSVSSAPSVSNAPSANTIANIACSTPDFSTLCALVVAAGLDDDLSGPGPFTVFAPTNAAFDALLAALGITLPPDLDDLDPALLATITDILLYHVVIGSVILKMELKCDGHVDTARDPANGDVDSQTQCLFVGNDEISFFQIGDGTLPLLPPQIVGFDIMATNGVIHVVNNVILPDNLMLS